MKDSVFNAKIIELVKKYVKETDKEFEFEVKIFNNNTKSESFEIEIVKDFLNKRATVRKNYRIKI